jgi:hypothetical protein
MRPITYKEALVKKMIFFCLFITVFYSPMLLCGEGQSPASTAEGNPISFPIAADPQNIPMEMLNPNHHSLTVVSDQQQVYDAVAQRRHAQCRSTASYCGKTLFFMAFFGTAFYLMAGSSKPQDAPACISISGNNTMTNCWQVVATNCGDCADSEQSDLQCASQDFTRSQLRQKVTDELNPICGPKTSICVKEATECSTANAQCTNNYSSFRDYLDQKCKPNPQSRNPRLSKQARLPKTKFKHKYR